VIQQSCIIEVFKLLCGYKKKGVGYKLEDLVHFFRVLGNDEPFGLRRKAKLSAKNLIIPEAVMFSKG